MLNKELKDQIQSLYRESIKAMDLTPRYGQRMMIAAIARTLGEIKSNDEGNRENDAGLAVIEAGTGTGKTLAYLIAALPMAITFEKKLLISTATIALQEQILDKDLPALKKHISLPFSYALAKGRGRYLCLTKLDNSLQTLSGILSTIDLFEQTPEEQDRALFEELLNAYGIGDWDGDRDRWPEEIPQKQWQHLTATHRECSNRRCPHFQNCAFYKARASMEDADIIIANHDLVLADLTLGGGAILPAPEKTVYVFDEGHHLADKALGHFRLDMGVRSQRQWLKQLEKGLDQFITQAGIPNSLMHSLREVPDHIRTLNQQVSLCWPLVLDLIGESDRLRFEFGRMPDSLRDLLETMRSPILPIVQCLDKLNDLLQKSLDPKEDSEIGRDIAESWQAPIGMMLSRAEAMSEALSWLAGEETAEQIPVARWLSRSPYGDDSDIIISASPISVAAQLRRNLWERAYGAVVTSATLTALDSFHTLQWESGLPDWAHYERVASPFNYAELGELEAVNLASDPKSDQFQSDVQTWLSEHVNLDEGTLVLFSSRAQLDATREFFIRDWYQSLLSQNYLPKADIVKRHKERIDSGKGSIIFGLASFAEGIDLPGDYLKHVVIVKIPFAVPDDPIHAAVGEWMESRGRNPFMELTLPAASIRLIQACGRLIRKETDRGRVSILDKRLTTSRYGQLLLNSLPPFKRV